MSKKRLLACIVIIMIIVGVVLLFITGFLYGGIKSPSEKVSIHPAVCKDDIEKFNTAFNSETKTLVTTIKISAKSVVDSIKNKPNYYNDADCVQMLFSYTTRIEANKDKKTAKQLYTQLEKLAQSGRYPSPQLDSLTSLKNSKDLLESWEVITPTNYRNDQPEVGR